MCGIGGVFNARGVRVKDIVSMSSILRHRGPDDEGFFLVDKLGNGKQFKGNDTISELSTYDHIETVSSTSNLAMVHRRLSILDVSPKGHQPMFSTNNRYCIVFNGEVYNYKEIKKELELLGVQFYSNTDTEVVLQAFIYWGENCVQKFVGMWAFSVYDAEEQILTFSRDRYGIKPLYFYKGDSYFSFASEIKALLPLEEVDSCISLTKLGSYLTYGTTYNPYDNLYENIVDAEPGYNYKYNLRTGDLTKSKYYSFESNVGQNSNSLNHNLNSFESAFSSSIALHLRSDVELGSCLSGGLDSSAIVLKASELLAGKQMKTFTASYANQSIDESEYANSVINSLENVNGVFTYPDSEIMMKELDQLIYHQDLPIGSTSIFAQWEVMKSAQNNGVKVLLDGQGADEVMGGYKIFAGIYLIEVLKKMRLTSFYKAFNEVKTNFTSKPFQSMLRALSYQIPAMGQNYLRSQKRLSFNLINQEFAKEIINEAPVRGGNTFKEQSILSMKYGMYELLRYEDRNSMAFSVESRVPFLDHRLVELIQKIPLEHLVHKGWSKFLIRNMLNHKLEDKVVWRKDKVGFVTPQASWKSKLSKKLSEEIMESKLPSIINRSYLEGLCGKNFSDPSKLSEFWRAYSVIKWFNVFKLNG